MSSRSSKYCFVSTSFLSLIGWILVASFFRFDHSLFSAAFEVAPFTNRRSSPNNRWKIPTTLPDERLIRSLRAVSSTTEEDETNHRSKLVLFNSKTRRKETFKPTNDPVAMYTCGPTVYDSAHVGNFRAFLTYDLVKRVLLYLGYRVIHVCNLTDVDDKIIQRANERQLKHVSELTLKYEGLFMEDLAALNIVPATHYPRATEYILEMMRMIQELAHNGLAYETPDGSWYFRTQAQPEYGQQLVQLDYEEMEQQQTDLEDAKEHFADFCLWKAFKEGVDRDDAAWSSADFSEWSSQTVKTDTAIDIQKGRPGWHLECSAMARSFFGVDTTLDLHGGGVDLKFPHHENEIAQSEGVMAPGTRFCNCWFHNGFVNIGEEKMSKSLGNFLTLRNACPTVDDVRAYRYLVISSHYRNPLAFTEEVMKAAKNAVRRIDKARSLIEDALRHGPAATEEPTDSEIANVFVPRQLANFESAILDDLSMPRAAASLFAVVKAAEQEFRRVGKDTEAILDVDGLRAIQSALHHMDQVFGVFYQVPVTEDEAAAAAEASTTVPDEVLELVSQRTAAKEAKDWELADSLRARISELGFAVKDVKGGDPIVSRVEV